MGRAMVARGQVKYEDFKVEGQMGSRAIAVLIRAQEIVSERGPYAYAEVGSYLGRTLQPHLMDADCKKVLSIDLRPDLTPDERGDLDDYVGISAEDMVARLAVHVPKPNFDKLITVTDTSDALRQRTDERYDLALIDGEHTIVAAFRDFVNLMLVMNDDSIVMFDDTSIVLPAIRNAEALLETRGIKHFTAHGRGSLTVIGMGAYADIVKREYTSDLAIRRAQADKRYKERMIESNIFENIERYLSDNQALRQKVEKKLSALG